MDYAAIKAAVSMREAAARYGVAVGRGGMAICPFHGEKTPSLKIYDDHFYCFGCGSGGDVVKFTAMLFSLTNRAAAEKLDSDFGLGLAGKPYNAAQALLREAQMRRKEAEEAEREALMRILLAKRRCLWNHRFDQRGKNQSEMFYLDEVIDHYDDYTTKEVRDLARRIPCVS